MPPVPTSAPMKNVSTEERLHRADMKPMSKEMTQCRWRMIEHILRQDQNNNCNIAITWAPEENWRRGRPKTTWTRTVEKERAEAGWQSWEEAKTVAVNRDKWRDSVKALCAMRHKEDRWGEVNEKWSLIYIIISNNRVMYITKYKLHWINCGIKCNA